MDMDMLAIDRARLALLATLILLLVAIIRYVIYPLALPRPILGIPYNKHSAKRLFGDLPEFAALQSKGISAKLVWPAIAAKARSPIAQTFMMPFMRPSIIVADYREVQDLTTKRAKELCRGSINNQVWGGLVPAHFISMEEHDPRASAARLLVKDLMTPSFLHEASGPASHREALEFIKLWQTKARIAKGRPFDADHDLEHLTFAVIRAAALGLSEQDDDTPAFTHQLQNGDYATMAMADADSPFPFPSMETPELLTAMTTIGHAASECYKQPFRRLFHMINNKRPSMKQAYETKRKVIQSYINLSTQRLEKQGADFKPRSAIDYMIIRENAAASKEGRQPDYSCAAMNEGVFGYLLGGQDSTHSTLTFMVKYLGEEQTAQKNLRNALVHAYPEASAEGRPPQLQEIIKTNVAYLDAFIQEVLRIVSPVSFLGRQAVNDMHILGHKIQRGTTLLLATTGPTYTQAGATVDEDIRSQSSRKQIDVPGDWGHSDFPPDKFIPERWLQPSPETGEMVFNAKAGPFMSFSSGPRTCWGKRLAWLELKLLTTLFVWNFAFEKLPETLHNWRCVDHLFMKPERCLVKLSNLHDEESD